MISRFQTWGSTSPFLAYNLICHSIKFFVLSTHRTWHEIIRIHASVLSSQCPRSVLSSTNWALKLALHLGHQALPCSPFPPTSTLPPHPSPPIRKKALDPATCHLMVFIAYYKVTMNIWFWAYRNSDQNTKKLVWITYSNSISRSRHKQFTFFLELNSLQRPRQPPTPPPLQTLRGRGV